MSLYLDPHFVDWMNDSILQRILVALRDRIPIKLREQGEANRKKKTGQAKKATVDVYRGSNYQIAYYFRKNTQNHSVLLKEKHLIFTQSAPPNRSASPDLPPPPHSHASTSNKRARSQSASTPAPIDLTEDVATDSDVRAGKRRAPERFDENAGAPLVDHPADMLLRVKDEPVDELMLPPQSTSRASQAGRVPLFAPEDEVDSFDTTVQQQAPIEEDEKPRQLTEADFEGQKPELKVSYTGYSIFGYTLVVIVEPYPALHPSAFAVRPSIGPVEVRQLSSSVQPESSRGRFSTTSATPAPQPAAKASQQPLFRSATTPLEGEERDRSESQGAGDSEAGDLGLDRFRESSQALANGWEGNDEEEEELPTLEDLVAEGSTASRR